MKATILALLGFLLLVAPTALHAQSGSGDGFDYNINASDTNTITVTEYTGQDSVVNIPTNINGLLVTVIGINDTPVFSSSLTSVTIPDTVTDISDWAFEGCSSLTTVTIPCSVVTVGLAAFGECTSLPKVTIPDSVTSIGEEAFAGCTSLTAIAVEAQDLFYSSTNGVLFDKSQATLVEYPGGLTEAYTIPGSVTSIGVGAFDYTSMTSITIPASVTNMAPTPFTTCNGLAAITVDDQNSFFSSKDGVLFDKSQAILLEYPSCKGGSYVIPGSVTNIGIEAFYACGGLTSVTIPDNVTSIGQFSFEDCIALTNATIGNGVHSIGEAAFDSCTSLTSITISSSVTNIEDFAFFDCSSLTSVYFTGDAPAVDSTVFSGDANVTAYYLPSATDWEGFSIYARVPVMLWNPLIQTSDGSFGIRNSLFGFNITGTNNFTVVVEACTNLVKPVWTSLQTVTLTNGSFYFSDPQWTNYPSRYYGLGLP